MGCLFGSCVLCGIIGGIQEAINPKPKEESKPVATTNNQSPSNLPVATPTSISTPPPTFAELKQKGEGLLKLDKEEYTQDDIKPFLDLEKQLAAIPKQAREYKEANNLKKKLSDKVIRLAAEKIVLGAKPQSGYAGKVYEVDNYLSKTLNDYDDSEYLEWTPVKKLDVKGEPYWAVGLKLRAKNAFGAKIVKDVVFFIRDGQVVKTTGL